MEVLTIGCHEEGILGVAEGRKLIFYGASYAYYAEQNKLPLVTEDSVLIEKARPRVKALKLDQIM